MTYLKEVGHIEPSMWWLSGWRTCRNAAHFKYKTTMENIIISVDFDSSAKSGWLCLTEIIDLQQIKNFVSLVADSPGMEWREKLVEVNHYKSHFDTDALPQSNKMSGSVWPENNIIFNMRNISCKMNYFFFNCLSTLSKLAVIFTDSFHF